MNQDTEDYDNIIFDKISHPNLLSIKPIFDMIGIGIPQQDVYYLTLSQEIFLRDTNVVSCRFWGKVFGLKGNYWIFEVQLSEDAIASRNESALKATISTENRSSSENESSLKATVLSNKDPSSDSVLPETTVSNVSNPDQQHASEVSPSRPEIPPLPQSTYVPTVETPSELLGEGLNRFLYYASNKPFGDTWHELPLVSPKDILVSKQIKKVLTGNLTARVMSYPKFDNAIEGYLLRALIARITASTFVAPLNYWVTRKPKDISGEEEEEVCVLFRIVKIEKKIN